MRTEAREVEDGMEVEVEDTLNQTTWVVEVEDQVMWEEPA